MITLKEIIGSADFNSLPKDHQTNLLILLEKINKVRTARAKPMRVTSGYRTMDDHIRIYRELATKRGQVFDQTKVPMKSKHLSGQAVDISDPDGLLFNWTKQNERLLTDIGLWMEEKDDQARVHFQTVPPASGNRWFIP